MQIKNVEYVLVVLVALCCLFLFERYGGKSIYDNGIVVDKQVVKYADEAVYNVTYSCPRGIKTCKTRENFWSFFQKGGDIKVELGVGPLTGREYLRSISQKIK